MSRFLKILLLVAILVTLGACSANESDKAGDSESKENQSEEENGGAEAEKFVMYAEIINVGDKIEVNVYEAEFAQGLYWINTDKNTEIIGKSGEKISLSDLKVGDKIKITYNGQVALSYPPQVYAMKLDVL